MRSFFISLAVLFGMLLAPPVQAEPASRILLVVSGHGRDQGRTRPGFEMDEFAQAWAVFRDNGFAVDVASPAGGAVEPDAFEPDKPYNLRILADAEATRALAATRTTAGIDPRDYAAVYVLGGGGAMFDLYADPALRALLGAAYANGAVVGGVCHGPAVLAAVRLPNGRPLVEGRRVTGFTNAEEEIFGERWAASYPALLETAMLASNARFEQRAAMLPHVVADGRIVTGQNPFSTALTVEAMIRAMGREPIARAPYPDERSLLLVARFLGGDAAGASAALAADPGAHDVPLIGIYGDVLAAQAGEDRARLGTALALMELAAAQVWHPRLELAMAQVEHRLGRTPEARARTERALERTPDMDAARRFFASPGD